MEVTLIGGSNNGARILTSDTTHPFQLAKRGQAAVSCDGKGIYSVFETYRPMAVCTIAGMAIVFVEEAVSDAKALEMLVEGYNV